MCGCQTRAHLSQIPSIMFLNAGAEEPKEKRKDIANITDAEPLVWIADVVKPKDL